MPTKYLSISANEDIALYGMLSLISLRFVGNIASAATCSIVKDDISRHMHGLHDLYHRV